MDALRASVSALQAAEYRQGIYGYFLPRAHIMSGENLQFRQFQFFI